MISFPFFRRRSLTLMFQCALAVALLGLVGCAHRISRLPQFYDAGGIPRSFKRHEVSPQRDFYHHWVRQAYYRPDHGWSMFEPLPGDQENTVKQWGRPDWIRKRYRSLQNERVLEWVYLDKQRVFQFVGPDLVFDGPLTEYEQILISRGYPDNTNYVIRENGEQEDLFVYTKVFSPWLEQFKFRDGYVIQSQEGNP